MINIMIDYHNIDDSAIKEKIYMNHTIKTLTYINIWRPNF